MEQSRTEIFQRLKPPCINLSQVALSIGAKGRGDGKALSASLNTLLSLLQTVAKPSSAFDSALADYVFFPLSHVFRQKQNVSDRNTEIALRCLECLLRSGWREEIAGELAKQLLILLTFIVGGAPTPTAKAATPGKVMTTPATNESSEELKIAALDCTTAVFEALANSPGAAQSLTETANVPALGHAVTVMLEVLTDGMSEKVQLAALSALEAFRACITDKDALTNFFPGMVSSATKVLHPKTHSKRTFKVLVRCVHFLAGVLKAVISDVSVKDIPKEEIDGKTKPTAKDVETVKTERTQAWLKASSAQVKLALANVVRLRNHAKLEVRQALLSLCTVVLDDCKTSLSESAPMMIETLIILCHDDADDERGLAEATLKRLAYLDPGVVDSIQGSLHNWVQGLPRTMQSNDEDMKHRVISQVSTSLRIVADLGVESSLVEEALAVNLRESVAAAVRASSTKGVQQISEAEQLNTNMDLIAPQQGQAPSKEFSTVLFGHNSQKETANDLQVLLDQLGKTDSALTIARESLEHAHSSQGEDQLASFWLALNLLRSASSTSSFSFSDLISMEGPSSTSRLASLTSDLFSLSLSVLTSAPPNPSLPPDPRLTALALEAVALEAHTLGIAFRPDLVDALYPVLSLLASPTPLLREHAIACLNTLASSLEYSSTSDLLVQNVDYLLNAVALSLNTFDISPKAPTVLLMMVKLTGPRLLPYMDDVVGSLMQALDSFHGYPSLVDLLFKVLGGIVDEGRKVDLPAIEGVEPAIGHRKTAQKPKTVEEVAKFFAEMEHSKIVDDLLEADIHVPTFEERLKEIKDREENPKPQDEDEEPPPREVEKAKPSKTRTLLTSIAQAIPPHLSTPSPPLRASLLSLLSRALQPVSHDEEALLPLINAIWPSITMRLHDEEAFVVVGAIEAVEACCVTGGDFLATRIQAEWGVIGSLWKKAMSGVTGEKGGKKKGGPLTTRMGQLTIVDNTPKEREITISGQGGLGVYTPSHKALLALLSLLTTLLTHVRLDESMYDDILDWTSALLFPAEGRERVLMAAQPLQKQVAELKEALEDIVPDALWLEGLYAADEDTTGMTVPELEGVIFLPVSI